MDTVAELIVGLIEIAVGLVKCWRMSLSVIIGIIMALFLSNAIEAFTAGYCISLVVVAFVSGLVWEVYVSEK